MAAVQVLCPQCGNPVMTTVAAGAMTRCRECRKAFRVSQSREWTGPDRPHWTMSLATLRPPTAVTCNGCGHAWLTQAGGRQVLRCKVCGKAKRAPSRRKADRHGIELPGKLPPRPPTVPEWLDSGFADHLRRAFDENGRQSVSFTVAAKHRRGIARAYRESGIPLKVRHEDVGEGRWRVVATPKPLDQTTPIADSAPGIHLPVDYHQAPTVLDVVKAVQASVQVARNQAQRPAARPVAAPIGDRPAPRSGGRGGVVSGTAVEYRMPTPRPF